MILSNVNQGGDQPPVIGNNLAAGYPIRRNVWPATCRRLGMSRIRRIDSGSFYGGMGRMGAPHHREDVGERPEHDKNLVPRL